jgi:aryl-alcohol dehydrogenase-like predicted oxidoreductase
MEHRRIGSLEVSAVGLGCNNFGYRLGSRETAAVVHAALDAGVTFFDTADNYGGGASEKYLGRALKGHRESVAIATKFGMPVGRKPGGASPDYVRRACEESLGALHGLVQSGNVREIGCSTFTAGQLREAREAARSGAAFASVQNGYNLLFREPEREVLAECERLGMAFIPSGPWRAAGSRESTGAGGRCRGERGSCRRRDRRSPASPASTSRPSRRWRSWPRRAGTRCWSWRSPGC